MINTLMVRRWVVGRERETDSEMKRERERVSHERGKTREREREGTCTNSRELSVYARDDEMVRRNRNK